MMTQADHVVAATVGDAEHAAQFGQISATLDEAMTLIRASVHDLKDEGTDFHSMVEDAASVDEGVPLTVHLADGIEHAPDVGHVLTRAIMMTQADHVVAATVGDAEHAAQFGQISATLDEAMTLIRASVHDLKDEGTDFHSMVEDAASVDEGVPLTVHLADGIEHAPAAVAPSTPRSSARSAPRSTRR